LTPFLIGLFTVRLSKGEIMQHVKIRYWFASITLILMLLVGCSGNPTNTIPTFTVVPPNTPIKEPSSTPEPKAEPGALGLGDSLFPYLGNSGYDVQHYTLDLMVNDVRTGDLSGITSIEAKATQNLSSFNLDFNSFEITNINVNGQPADFKRYRQELTITPLVPLKENESFTVEVRYQGAPQEMMSVAIPMRVGWVTYHGGSYVMSEPEGAMDFFPANNHPIDKASYTFRVTVPKPFDVVANGVLVKTMDDGTTTTFMFEMPDPMASYLATINIGKFDLETSQAENGIPIRNYFSTELPESIRKPFELQGEMLVYFSDIFGPYPFDVYGALVIDTETGGALEDQTLSVFGITEADNLEDIQLQLGIAHELAHQWFGDSVSVADWHDIWLNESFATYAEGLWIEHSKGRDALDDWVKKEYASVLKYKEQMTPPGEPVANNLFNGGVYSWGALGLHALRLEVGDEKFFEILKTYCNLYKGGNARTIDFINVAEDVSGKDLSAFFDSWLYSRDLVPIPALGLKAKP
jgi:aminopeptidase N